MSDDDLARQLFTRTGGSARTPGRGAKPKAQYSSANLDDRDPQPVDEVLRRWVRDHGVAAEVGTGSVVARWAEIVGPELAERVIPDGVRERDGQRELLLRAESTAWATQVRLLGPQILGRIRQLLGAGVVDRLSVAGPAPPRGAQGTRRVPGRGPRDTYG